MLSVLGEKLHDNRFLRLLKYLLKAGYVEDWKYGRTLSGTPQGGIVSPLLANIYLDRLDKFVENVMIPAHTRGSDRRDNREYTRLLNQAARQRKRGNHAEALQRRKQMQQLPSRDPYDPGYRRLRYVRYADDFVLGFIGPKVEAQQVKESLETFLHDTLLRPSFLAWPSPIWEATLSAATPSLVSPIRPWSAPATAPSSRARPCGTPWTAPPRSNGSRPPSLIGRRKRSSSQRNGEPVGRKPPPA